MDNTDESVVATKTDWRAFRTSENPLVRNKGFGSPIGSLVAQGSLFMPTTRLGHDLLLSGGPYKNTRKLTSITPSASIPAPSKAVASCGDLLVLEESKLDVLYEHRKVLTDPKAYGHDIFFTNDFLGEYESNSRPKPPPECEAYRLKVEAILEHANKCAKDLAKFPAGVKTLCLGLESVLMNVSTMGEDADEKVPIFVNETLLTEFSLNHRPHMFDFLKDMKGRFELVLYSALNKAYVTAIVDCIQRSENYFAHVLGEDFCVFANFAYGVKSLDFLLSNRRSKDIIFVDTTVKSLPAFSDNFVPISAYTSPNQSDQELPKLAALLEEMCQGDDVRKAIAGYRENKAGA